MKFILSININHISIVNIEYMSLRLGFKQTPTFGGKKKNEFVKLEDCHVHQRYSFSYNPVDQPIMESPTGFKDWWQENYNFFRSMLHSTYQLYCELSPHGRWHFHGYVWVTNVLKFYMYDVPRMSNCACSMDSIGPTFDDENQWLAYCIKQQNQLSEFIKDELYGLVAPDGNSFITLFTDPVISKSRRR